MEKVLAHPQARRLFFGLLGTVACLLLVLLLAVLPANETAISASVYSIMESTLQGMLGSVIATAAFAAFAYWLLGREISPAELELVAPADIGPGLQALRSETDRYWFSGGTGTFTRRVTLPDLADKCAVQGNKEIRLHILDPRDERVCETYSKYRAQTRPNKPWDAKRVRNELLATLTAAIAWRNSQARMLISVRFHQLVSHSRYDFSTRGLIVTWEGPQDPALRSSPTSFLYRSFQQELELAFLQAEEFDADRSLNFTKPTKDAVREVAAALDMPMQGSDLDRIAGLATERGSPYA